MTGDLYPNCLTYEQDSNNARIHELRRDNKMNHLNKSQKAIHKCLLKINPDAQLQNSIANKRVIKNKHEQRIWHCHSEQRITFSPYSQ